MDENSYITMNASIGDDKGKAKNEFVNRLPLIVNRSQNYVLHLLLVKDSSRFQSIVGQLIDNGAMKG
jgi:hypothetical protein